MAAGSSLDHTDWQFRSSEFGAVRVYDGECPIVVMELEPTERDRAAEWIVLRHLWLGVGPHAQILDAIDRAGTKLLLRYAAIDWNHAPVRLDTSDMARRLAATWGAQITDAFCRIVNYLPDGDIGHFLRPLVKIDLANDARLAFLPVAPGDPHLPPEARSSWPRCDEPTVMYVIGSSIRDHCAGLDCAAARPVRTIIERCLQPRPWDRYRILDDLRTAWAQLALPGLEGARATAWQHAQAGLGWLQVRQPRSALHDLRAALHLNPRLRVAKIARDRALAAVGESVVASETSRKPTARRRSLDVRVSWGDVLGRGLRLEAEHQFAEARSLYGKVRMGGPNDAEIHAAMARCQLALGAVAQALDHARHALAIEPKRVDALAVSARGHLLARRPADALRFADDWLDVAPEDGHAHYARGRGLLAMGRFVEAREAFDRACVLRPQMLEAMLLRREADRSARRAAEAVGTPNPMALDLPAHLEVLRDALVAGRVRDAILVLERPEYRDDAIATLVRAECLAFERRFEEAIAMYDRAVELSSEQRPKALIGKVHALLILERAVEALVELDAAADVVDVDLIELRGLALHRLGLTDDAERELGQAVAASGSRSDLRVGRR